MFRVKEALTKYGLADKEVAVYLALLRLGPRPVRKIGTEAELNRGTTYDILKSLQDQGLVSYYQQEKHQYFVAEDPRALLEALEEKRRTIETLRVELKELVPQLRSMSAAVEDKPVVKYYEGVQGVRQILQDVLESTATISKEYYVYSSANVRQYLYEAYPNYTIDRIARKLSVKVIALGAGGSEVELAERRWLTKDTGAPTYTLLYACKVAMVSPNPRHRVHGVVIEDAALFETQKVIFEKLWEKL